MQHFEKILVVYETAERDRTALHLAVRLAGMSGGTVSVAHVLPPLPEDLSYGLGNMDELKEDLEDAAERTLRGALEGLPECEAAVETRVVWGHTAMEVSRVVLNEEHDLVMKGTSGRKHLSGQLLGSVDMRLLRKCPCPVWLVKPGTHEDLTSVLAIVDPMTSKEKQQELNEHILRLALSLATLEEAELHVLHAWSAWGGGLLRSRLRSNEFSEYEGRMRSRAARAFSELLRPYDAVIPQTCRHLIEGEPEDVVPKFVRDRAVDVVVMGTVVKTGVPGFFIGNTAEMILGDVDCSVLAVKPEGFVSPVEADPPEG